MVSFEDVAKFYGLKDIIKKMMDLGISMFGMNKIILFIILSCALVMVFQGKNYKNICLSLVVGFGLEAMDPKIHSRLLGLAPNDKGAIATILRGLSKIYANEAMFGTLCFLMAYVINMCVLPICWALAFAFCSCMAKDTFTNTLRDMSAQELFFNVGFLFLIVSALKNFKKSELIVYALFFSIAGSLFSWMALEAILDEDLGFGAIGLDIFDESGRSIFYTPQVYPFIVLVGIGMISQIRFKGIMSFYRRQNVTLIEVKRTNATNKIIEI